MGQISPVLPTVNDPRGGEEIDVGNALLRIIQEFNGKVDEGNLNTLLGPIKWGSSRGSPDVQISRFGPAGLLISGEGRAVRATTSQYALSAGITGDTVMPFAVRGDGTVEFGDGGNTARDAAVGRGDVGVVDVANVLNAYDGFQVGGVDLASTHLADTAALARQSDLVPLLADKAPLASPIFTGDPKAPTPPVDDNDTSISTTAWFIGQRATGVPLMDGTADAGSGSRWSASNHRHPSDISRAPLTSPTFAGTLSAVNAADEAVEIRSGASGSWGGLGVGRTGVEAQLVVAAAAGEFLSEAVAGNLILRVIDGTKEIQISASGNATLRVGGANKLGFYGHVPVVRPAAYSLIYTGRGRELDNDAGLDNSNGQLANVLAQLIADLKANGLVA